MKKSLTSPQSQRPKRPWFILNVEQKITSLMRFDPDKYFEALAEAVRAQKSFQNALRDMNRWCAAHLPHSDWNAIADLDISEDETKAQKWIPDVLKKYSCPFEIQALYFGLSEKANSKGEEFGDLYVAFMGQYDPADEKAQWVFGDKRHYPEKSSLKVKTLKSAGLIFNREGGDGLGNEGNFMFCMSYAVLLVASLMSSELYERFGTRADRVGMLAGWDSGDLMRPGELTRSGFVPNPKAMI
jgi:hypothetical protein